MLESVLQSGLISAGADVNLLGPMPTPAIAYLAKTLRADAAIVISASHNPYYDNGIKFFDAEGSKFGDATELAIEAAMEGPLFCEDSENLGKASRVSMRLVDTWSSARAQFLTASVCAGYVLSWIAHMVRRIKWHPRFSQS